MKTYFFWKSENTGKEISLEYYAEFVLCPSVNSIWISLVKLTWNWECQKIVIFSSFPALPPLPPCRPVASCELRPGRTRKDLNSVQWAACKWSLIICHKIKASRLTTCKIDFVGKIFKIPLKLNMRNPTYRNVILSGICNKEYKS